MSDKNLLQPLPKVRSSVALVGEDACGGGTQGSLSHWHASVVTASFSVFPDGVSCVHTCSATTASSCPRC